MPRTPSLKRSKSRGRSQTRGAGERSRSQTSPQRTDQQKPVGCLPSSFFAGDSGPSLPPMPPLPDDAFSPALKTELLKWIAMSLRRDWKDGAKPLGEFACQVVLV